MRQLSNPGPMRISSLLNDQGTPMPQYSQLYSIDLSRITQHASRLEKEAKPISMLQPNGRPSKRPDLPMLGLSHTLTEQTRVDHDTESAPGLSACRKKYSKEECYFIWHQRVVLQKEWDSVLKNFNNQFQNRQRLFDNHHGYGGLKLKLKRFIKLEGLPDYQDRTVSSSNDEDFITSCTNVWYSWME